MVDLISTLLNAIIKKKSIVYNLSDIANHQFQQGF